MKLNLFTCMECFQENGYPPIEVSEVEINSDHIYQQKCGQGHTTYILLQNLNFEVLFDLGIHALNDGHPDSAVTRFTVALERFYNFSIQVLLLKNSVDLSEIEKFVKTHLSKRSEREIGAFLALFFLEPIEHSDDLPEHKFVHNIKMAKCPQLDITEFRNKVVHQGYIPNHEQAYEYGEIIYNFISHTLRYFKRHYAKEIDQIISKHLNDAKSKIENINSSSIVSSMNIGTTIRLVAAPGEPNKTFQEAIDIIKDNNYGFKK